MSVLSHDAILKAFQTKEIVITPLNENAVGPASVDLSLDNEFRIFKNKDCPMDIKESTNYREETDVITIKDGEYFEVQPHTTCLGITRETVTLSNGICGLLEGRSRFARLGLFVHITASFMNPGISNRQVLEIYNSSNRIIRLYPGERVCQMIFMRMDGTAQYKGIFEHNYL
ncbi:deoxycytidine triphosphate deaminase [Entamoeba histolytica HM-3:IMSS]|uniref:Deoxycytidine triphosphate deaminase, putative n=5 Tax=Entamoeba histolytica TaxID=5759 RepID=C4M472_ENTH1|nr:deoxycytidine triphosphate deaminase, putative [Entamoeba histolytica HM-1:IMSS]EMD48295.1 deoxycytidine triphosphate deaminase, putative [Entamoeba histolytica KU27]EMS16885.1 deoxycytidine triphosphate deaminase [Entamoeba histolytica HM-3:IMSS]ENY64406.1 deoxycytidine triphosphate deaminase, putative [Entamoeba histolytica HM-1:IMSS-A]GAT96152.1 deoxycytidine triphosphate deaminase putative [Entamoeba histolytica]EAL51348.1 deoxycytidine triphosphate deaminase, putative [Entamoeba histol|eukprot:XP_656749.1 deoxycytidine triphosphate deaminase, putative [Entamoeba histolytica HM-1:IMSS]